MNEDRVDEAVNKFKNLLAHLIKVTKLRDSDDFDEEETTKTLDSVFILVDECTKDLQFFEKVKDNLLAISNLPAPLNLEKQYLEKHQKDYIEQTYIVDGENVTPQLVVNGNLNLNNCNLNLDLITVLPNSKLFVHSCFIQAKELKFLCSEGTNITIQDCSMHLEQGVLIDNINKNPMKEIK